MILLSTQISTVALLKSSFAFVEISDCSRGQLIQCVGERESFSEGVDIQSDAYCRDKSCLILCFVIAFLHAIHSMHIADGVNVVVFSFSM